MHKYIPLLVPIFIFTFIFDHYAIVDTKIIKIEKNLVNPQLFKENIVNVHKNFDFKFNSTTINKFYSKKVIEKSKILNSKNTVILQPKKKFKEKTKVLNSINLFQSNNSLELISSNWQKNFSNKKIKFIKTVLPIIEHENQKIIIERKKLLEIKKFISLEKTLNKNDLKYLKKISKKYKIPTKNKHKVDIINELLISVNMIPNSIVLAQAVNESGWGKSRFATEYNALFGQYTYDTNKGIVPYDREEGKKHLIKNFTSIDKSVESYFTNINSHYAYENFRKARSEIDNFNNDFNIKVLTNTLDVYAEDKSYVDTINNIIDSNKLIQFDFISKGLLNS